MEGTNGPDPLPCSTSSALATLAPIAVEPSATMSAFVPHPSQGSRATSAAREDILVVFLHEVTQSMAMTTQASSRGSGS
jgi:hypothetical protein